MEYILIPGFFNNQAFSFNEEVLASLNVNPGAAIPSWSVERMVWETLLFLSWVASWSSLAPCWSTCTSINAPWPPSLPWSRDVPDWAPVDPALLLLRPRPPFCRRFLMFERLTLPALVLLEALCLHGCSETRKHYIFLFDLNFLFTRPSFLAQFHSNLKVKVRTMNREQWSFFAGFVTEIYFILFHVLRNLSYYHFLALKSEIGRLCFVFC